VVLFGELLGDDAHGVGLAAAALAADDDGAGEVGGQGDGLVGFLLEGEMERHLGSQISDFRFGIADW